MAYAYQVEDLTCVPSKVVTQHQRVATPGNRSQHSTRVGPLIAQALAETLFGTELHYLDQCYLETT